ncbi:hypothetical protein ACT4VI_07605 [Acinetobacter baumannii]|uniref:hypothetical protein n=1 Tax=Acinetobacter baumannii TaxID=470 RepID=UPI000BBCB1B6|nr:hypothetical protein [Acinetobacter baumannii]MCY3369042.1 hypothetical protein [Acinetobacter baumannii]MDC5212722.1 hypothetical protein [Acinetobacter baumannii]MDC5234320.1 hypothetical protein [Acinetobacter baumannii]MDC5276071.1 hypothetical protein [Acinetobacter baumannii]MDC5471123.1 hypothetical protein [Acinetobacter baumannii]
MTGNERIPFESQFKTTEIFKRESAIRKNDILAFSETMNGYFNIVTNDAWQLWNKAKAETVPDTHILIPKEPNRKTIMAMACVCLGPVGSGPEFLTLKEAKDVYSALVEKESGAEG